mmetsp:Transcript_36214/g.56562  ORF Transcript_36214/g.56562 Transcript_36214/m.56562 type:complete len:215 (-) Transcript_36214:1114-1758(-)
MEEEDDMEYDDSEEPGDQGHSARVEELNEEAAQRPSVEPPQPLKGKELEEKLSRNGAVTDSYIWSQNKKEVVINFFLPPGTKAKEVSITLKSQRLKLSRQGQTIIDKELAFPVHEVDEDLDWEVKDFTGDTRRLLSLTVLKALPHTKHLTAFQVEEAGVFWWKGVFKGDPEIDTTQIPDRQSARTVANRKAWEEAHEKFRELVKNIEPTEVPTD